MTIEDRNRKAAIFLLLNPYANILDRIKASITSNILEIINGALEVKYPVLQDLGIKTYIHKGMFDVIPEKLKSKFPIKCNIKLAFYCESEEQIDYILYNIHDWIAEDRTILEMLDSYLTKKQELVTLSKYIKTNLKDLANIESFRESLKYLKL